MKTLVVTHIYELAEQFVQEMFDSVSAQTDQDFDFLVFNYGLSRPLSEYTFDGFVIENQFGFGIPDARQWTIKYAERNGFDLLIFIDADDVMAVDRVEKTKNVFSYDFCFYYTDLYLLGEWEQDFFDGQTPLFLDSFWDVSQSNFIGLSNFALNLTSCRDWIRSSCLPSGIIAYDWYIVSQLLIMGYKGQKVRSKTFYRLHGNNTAGITSSRDLSNIGKTIKVKSLHYEALSKEFSQGQKLVGKKVLDFILDQRSYYQELDEIYSLCPEDLAKCYPDQPDRNTCRFWWNSI